MGLTFKSIVYLIVSIVALFCFTYSMINHKNEFVLSLEMYTTLGSFFYYAYSFFREIKGSSFIADQNNDLKINFFSNMFRFIFSYKFLYSILISSYLGFIILSLRSNWENWDRDNGTILVMVLSRIFLPIFSILNIAYGIEKGRLTTGNDLTGLIFAFLIFFLINVILLKSFFAPEEKFLTIISVTLGNVLMSMFLAISAIPMHDYFLKVKVEERLLV